MKFQKTLSFVALAACLIAAPAVASEEIAKKNGCMVCHGVDKKMVGPAYKQIADKNKTHAGAAATLTKHVRDGSKGVWGPIVMPPQAKISDADLKAVIDWMLKL